jgi:hypothetical protein
LDLDAWEEKGKEGNLLMNKRNKYVKEKTPSEC